MSDINTWVQSFNTIVKAFRAHSLEAIGYTTVFWAIHLLNILCSMRLTALGIRPREPMGLIGIVFSPFLHGSWNHLFFNSLPFFLLALLTMAHFPSYAATFGFLSTCSAIILFSGIANWILARPGIHIGASGLIMGLWGYIIFQSYFSPRVDTIIISLICVYYLGGLVANLLHAEDGVSLEGHIFGFLSGVLAAYLS